LRRRAPRRPSEAGHRPPQAGAGARPSPRKRHALAEGRERITLLIAERQKQKAASVEALAAEEQRAADLAGQHSSLRDLIAKMETENATAAAAAAAAENAATIARTEEGNRPAKSLGAPGRLTPSVAFVNAKGCCLCRPTGSKSGGLARATALAAPPRGFHWDPRRRPGFLTDRWLGGLFGGRP